MIRAFSTRYWQIVSRTILLLSHDLIEGAHVRTGLATDIELFDEFPADYISYSRRQHRWIRGDWQIADWIFPRVPDRNIRGYPIL